MKKLLVALLAIALVAGASVSTANAQPRGGWHGRGGERHEFHGGGCVGCGFLGGLVLGGVLGGVLAAPYYAAPPAPVYAPPPPACYTQPGHWEQVPAYAGPYGYTYRNVWVPPQTVCQ